MAELKDVERPYHVVALLGGEENFAAGCMTLEEAETNASLRNERAAELGIVSRYEAREGPYMYEKLVKRLGDS